MMSVLCVAIFWVVNANRNEKSCLQFSIPTGIGAGGEGGVPHHLKNRVDNLRMHVSYIPNKKLDSIEFSALRDITKI